MQKPCSSVNPVVRTALHPNWAICNSTSTGSVDDDDKYGTGTELLGTVPQALYLHQGSLPVPNDLVYANQCSGFEFESESGSGSTGHRIRNTDANNILQISRNI